MISSRRSFYMLLVGGVHWVGYLAYVHLLLALTPLSHSFIEAAGIPVSLVSYYLSNTYLVFHQTAHWRTFGSFGALTLVGWLGFLTASYVSTDLLGFPVLVGHLVGVGVNASVNVIVQQGITWGVVAGRSEELK